MTTADYALIVSILRSHRDRRLRVERLVEIHLPKARLKISSEIITITQAIIRLIGLSKSAARQRTSDQPN